MDHMLHGPEEEKSAPFKIAFKKSAGAKKGDHGIMGAQ